MIPTWTFAIAFTLIGVGIAVWQSRAPARERAAHQLARKVDLALDPTVEPVVATRLAARAQEALR